MGVIVGALWWWVTSVVSSSGDIKVKVESWTAVWFFLLCVRVSMCVKTGEESARGSVCQTLGEIKGYEVWHACVCVSVCMCVGVRGQVLPLTVSWETLVDGNLLTLSLSCDVNTHTHTYTVMVADVSWSLRPHTHYFTPHTLTHTHTHTQIWTPPPPPPSLEQRLKPLGWLLTRGVWASSWSHMLQ